MRFIHIILANPLSIREQYWHQSDGEELERCVRVFRN
jgi:hypothetical protein